MNCLQGHDREDIHMTVKLNVAGNVNSSFGNFLNKEFILDRECPVCLFKHNASLEKSVGSWKVSDYTLKKIFIEWWRLGEGYEFGELCYGTLVFFCRLR